MTTEGRAGGSLPEPVNEALGAVARLRDLLLHGRRRKLPAYLADSAADDLATIERVLLGSVDGGHDSLPMYPHHPERMLRGD